MGRIKNIQKYPFKATPVGEDYVIVSDSENSGKSVSVKLSDVVSLALGAGVTDTFATLNGAIINFPDGQTIDVTPVVDTDTNTFATVSNTVITFENGDILDVSDGDAVINGNIITFGDGQTRDITPVVDTDTDTFATFAGGTITFPDGQTAVFPQDDQTATEVLINPIVGLTAANVQAALVQILGMIPTSTSGLTNDGDTGANTYLTELPTYTLGLDTNDLILFADGVELDRQALPNTSTTVEDSFTSTSTDNALSAKKGNDILNGLNRISTNDRLGKVFNSVTYKQTNIQSEVDMTNTTFDRNVIIQRLNSVNYLFIEDGVLDSSITDNIIQDGNLVYVSINDITQDSPISENNVTPRFLFANPVTFTPISGIVGTPANYKAYVISDRDGAGLPNSLVDSTTCTIHFHLMKQEVSITGENGITVDTGVVKLGGDLTENTEVQTLDQTFSIQSSPDAGVTVIDSLFVDTVGNVGVNTDIPTEELDIDGDVRVRGITDRIETDEILAVDTDGVIRKIPNSDWVDLTPLNGWSAQTFRYRTKNGRLLVYCSGFFGTAVNVEIATIPTVAHRPDLGTQQRRIGNMFLAVNASGVIFARSAPTGFQEGLTSFELKTNF